MKNKYHPALFWFAVLTAFVTFLLIGLGGLVTSHDAGMSVPDWPTTYGYSMFRFPISKMVGGVLYEHTHRLLATFVGMLTTVLAVWIWLKDGRKWLHWLGIAAFFLVIVQGIMGGLRVVLHMEVIGLFHGAIAQVFLALLCSIALFLSRWWQESATQKTVSVPRGLRKHVLYVTLLIFIQLLLGATMRQAHAGLSINTFPLAYGKLWPATSPAAIAEYNSHRIERYDFKPITAFQVDLQMVHRLVALLILLGVAAAAFLAWKKLGSRDELTKFTWFWAAMVIVQIILGAATVLTNKAADIATLHVMGGAILLLVGVLWCLMSTYRTRLAQ